MKKSNFIFKLLTIMIAFVIIGCFQLNASQAQQSDNSNKVPITIFSSAYKHIPGLEKDANKIIKTVRKEFDLYDRRMNYHRVAIDVVDENSDAEGDFLVVYFLLKDRYSTEISKITLEENYEVLWIENDYKLKKNESSTEWLAYEYGTCPDQSVEIVLSTCCTDIPTAVAGINYSYNAAVDAGYNTVKLLGSQENTTDIDHWLSCPNLKYWGRIGHGYTGGIVLYDGNLTSSYFDSLPTGALQDKSLYFNSCQVFNNPLKSSILNKDAYKFIGGICSLYIGPSEEVFKCWNDNNFYQVTPPGGEPDEMCYWSEECESSTGYPEPGCHGCGGPGLIFPLPGGSEPPIADFTADTTTIGAGGIVYFTDLSTNNPTSWSWTFAGGTPSGSTDQNPTITYNTPGTYTVSLTAANSLGSDTETKTDYITVTVPQTPVADFSASSTNIHEGQSLDFSDLSINTPTSWSWTFTGGTPSGSSDQNPTITYNTIGIYTVSLTATNAAGSDTETKIDYITVSEAPIEYCTSSGNSQSYEYIAGVLVGDLNNTSGASGYSDFTSMTANLTEGASTSVSLTPGFTSSSYTEYWKIWIDYNVDGDFEDSGEEVFSGSGSSVVSGNFTVSSGTAGVVTRMRVSMSYSTYPPMCGTFTYGEVEDYTASITGVGPQYTLTTNTVGQGSITLNPPGGTYSEGTVVTLTAVPASGWQFDNWSGDLSGSTNPTTITMNSDKSVTAHFSEVPVNQYTLTVNTVGQGSVTLNPPGGVYDEGTVVTLTAVPDTGWQFDNWSGDLGGSANPTTITMNSHKTVTANFSESGGCTEIVGYNTVFSLSTTTANRRAMPFTMPENGEICSVTMYHNGGSGSMIMGVYDGESLPNNRLGVTATTPVSGSTGWQTIDLTSPAFVAGGAKVWLAWVYESNPGMYYESGSPGRASSSQTWSGGMPDPFGSSTTADYIYSIYANYTPTAPPQYTLTVNVVGNGSVALNPPGGVYDAGTVVTLTATPDSGWSFSSWSGDLSGSTNPTTITMNSNKTVTATFIEEGTTGTVGYETVFGSTSVSAYRRALPFTMPENGTITSVTMYHTGGSGSMILGVYDGEGTPQNRLGVTPTTAVSGSTGWQTINLTGSAFVSGGDTVWLAWVYENNPGIRYQTGSPGRYQSSQTWSGGMPDPFGSGSQTTYIYSIYATYTIN
jgi:PKD repeat protein